jgi:hypothetical protein
MLTRALFLVVLLLGAVAPMASGAGESKVLALGLSDHEVTQGELEKGEALPPPRFNTGGVAYGLAADLKKGDAVEVALIKDGKPLHHNSETLTEDKARLLLQAGKRGVPAGGWPEGQYAATLKVTRDGKTLIEQASTPIPIE